MGLERGKCVFYYHNKRRSRRTDTKAGVAPWEDLDEAKCLEELV